MKVYARASLIGQPLGRDEDALLLEGAWPGAGDARGRWSLDEAIDARFAWIDQEASRLAEEAAAQAAAGAPTPAYLNALALRYYCVKLLRVVAFFGRVRELGRGEVVRLYAARDRDEDYAELLDELCRAAGARLEAAWVDRPQAAPCFPPNRLWRRLAARIIGWSERARIAEDGRPRVVLCGNPRLLDPVCRELLRRRCRVWWLYDRLAVGSWLRWHLSGVGQLVCDSSLGRKNRLAEDVFDRLDCRGVDLSRPVRRWLARMATEHGPRQTRAVEQIEAHFARVRPTRLVLDEDATPLPRAAIAAARRLGAVSAVVQHGAPCIRFGFSPAEADRLLVWGESSRQQLIGWGVDARRIRVTGSPRHDALVKTSGNTTASHGSPTILLLATVPPRNERPDAAAFHLTSRTHGAMLRMACESVAKIAGARLVVKLHPRTPRSAVLPELLTTPRSLSIEVVRSGSLARCVAGSRCVLSCASSAGVEAALWGVPVIQLMPAGSHDLLAAQEWGLLGTARTEEELDRLLGRVLAEPSPGGIAPDPYVFGNLEHPATGQVADAILAPVETPAAPHVVLEPEDRQRGAASATRPRARMEAR